MKIAVEGCCHGELDKIYETVEYVEQQEGIKVDLLLICGDFQAVRNKSDLKCMAVPPKYQKMNTFYKYYSGEKTAPVLTVFIGGNHEASNYNQELPYGGWVAPKIYYMGYANILRFGNIRIGGLSGIYKSKDFHRGHYERPPYNEESKRSAYHVRNLEVFRLKQVSSPIDIFLSHDWPTGIYNYGDVDALLNKKRFFKEEVESGTLGSAPCEELLYHLKPQYWFSAHLHVKFAAVVKHKTEKEEETKITKFLSLDKCLPGRKFLQVIDVPGDADSGKLELDPEWMCILKSTNHLLSLSHGSRYMPGPGSDERYDFKVKSDEANALLEDFGGDVTIPENFAQTVPAFNKNDPNSKPSLQINPQTTLLCTMLELTDPNAVFLGKDSSYQLELSLMDTSANDSLDTSNLNNSTFIETDAEGDLNESQKLDSSFNPEEIDIPDSDDAPSPDCDRLDDSTEGLENDVKELSTCGLDESKLIDNPMSSPLPDIDDNDEELREMLLAQKSHLQSTPNTTPKYRAENDLKFEGDIPHSDSTDDNPIGDHHSLDTDDTTDDTANSSIDNSADSSCDEKCVKRADDGSLLEESPQSKKLKRRNISLYSEEEN